MRRNSFEKHVLAISFLDSPWTTQENLWKIVGFSWEFLTPQFSEKKNREAKLNFQRKVLKRIQAFSVSKFKQNNSK
jgi:hypothetical protein